MKNAIFRYPKWRNIRQTRSPNLNIGIVYHLQVWKFNGDDKELVAEERDERFVWPTRDLFAVQLFSPVSWEPIAGTK